MFLIPSLTYFADFRKEADCVSGNSLTDRDIKRLGRGGGECSLCKIRSRHPRKLKLLGLIAYIMFYKIW